MDTACRSTDQKVVAVIADKQRATRSSRRTIKAPCSDDPAGTDDPVEAEVEVGVHDDSRGVTNRSRRSVRPSQIARCSASQPSTTARRSRLSVHVRTRPAFAVRICRCSRASGCLHERRERHRRQLRQVANARRVPPELGDHEKAGQVRERTQHRLSPAAPPNRRCALTGCPPNRVQNARPPGPGTPGRSCVVIHVLDAKSGARRAGDRLDVRCPWPCARRSTSRRTLDVSAIDEMRSGGDPRVAQVGDERLNQTL
jgi:hypothetical protein